MQFRNYPQWSHGMDVVERKLASISMTPFQQAESSNLRKARRWQAGGRLFCPSADDLGKAQERLQDVSALIRKCFCSEACRFRKQPPETVDASRLKRCGKQWLAMPLADPNAGKLMGPPPGRNPGHVYVLRYAGAACLEGMVGAKAAGQQAKLVFQRRRLNTSGQRFESVDAGRGVAGDQIHRQDGPVTCDAL